MKIIKYGTIADHTLEELDVIINKKIEEGFQPFGGVCYDDDRYIQVVVKYEEIKQVDPYGHLSGLAYATIPPDFKLTPGKLVPSSAFKNEAIEENEQLKKELDDAPRAYDGLLDNLIELEKENLLLKEIAVKLVEKYKGYNEREGYHVFIFSDEYYSKDHSNYPEQILNSIVEHQNRIRK